MREGGEKNEIRRKKKEKKIKEIVKRENKKRE